MRALSYTFLLVALLIAAIPATAQINITTADVLGWYAAGKALRELQRSGDQFTYTFNAGHPSSTVPQSWTLPTVQYTDTMLVRNAAPATTPYASQFPTATHAQFLEVNSGSDFFAMYGYSRIVNDSLYSLGSVFRQKFSTVDTTTYDQRVQFIVTLPIGVTSSFSPTRDSTDRGSGSYEIENAVEVVDAFGTITLPTGSFACLRTLERSRYRKFTPPSTIDTFTVVRFHWYTKEGHSAQVAATYSDTTQGTIRVTEVRYTMLIAAPVGVAEEPPAIPRTAELLQNYPNPFNPATSIMYRLSSTDYCRLSVVDLFGREVAVLVNEQMPAGTHQAAWQALGMPSGVYFARLTTATATEMRKMVLTK